MPTLDQNIEEARSRDLLTPDIEALIERMEQGAPTKEAIAFAEAEAVPRSFEDRLQSFRRGTRMSTIAGGAFIGGEIGSPFGLGGLIAGASLGAMAGSLMFDSANDALEAVIPEFKRVPGSPRGIPAQLKAASTEGMFEVGTLGLTPLLFPVKRFLTPLVGKVMGVRGQESRALARLAELQGINLGAVDVGGQMAKGFAKVLGVFPFTGTPFRTARTAKEAAVAARLNTMLNDLAPTSTLAGEIGVDLFKAAQKSDRRFRRISAQLYGKFRELANGAGDIVPTTGLKATVGEFVEEFRIGQAPIGGGQVTLRSVETGADEFGPIFRTVEDVEPVQILKGGIDEQFEAFLRDAAKLPERISLEQFQLLKKRFRAFADRLPDDGFVLKRVAQIKQAMEADLNNLFLDGIEEGFAREILAAKQSADTFFANGIVVFQTATAQRFGRVDKRIFKPGFARAGTLNPDELLKPVFNADSAAALSDLRSLVGESAFRRATRNHFDDAVSRSFKTEIRGAERVEVFDADTFAKNLGLVDGFKNRTAALEEMLRGTDVTVEMLQDLASAARIAKISDPAAFITRRVTIGGVAAVTGAAGVGGAVLGGGPGGVGASALALGVTLLTRRFSRLLASPEGLRALTRAFSPTLSEVNKRALVLRVIRLTGTAKDQKRP